MPGFGPTGGSPTGGGPPPSAPGGGEGFGGFYTGGGGPSGPGAGRIFSANFLAQAARKDGASPYMVLEIDYTDQTRYYLDRPVSSIVNNQGDLPAIQIPLVLQWPSVSLSLKEGQVGYVDQNSVTLDDTNGAITALLSGIDQQRQLVKVWRMFDDPTCAWGTDNGLIFAGCLRPFDWTGKDNQITLNVGDLGPFLAKSISFPATRQIFPRIPGAYQDRQLPLCWGNANRVEAVLVQKPFETQITQPFAGDADPTGPTYSPQTLTIADDPDDMGVDGTGATSYVAYLGTDWCTVTFHQSPTPGNGTSTATIAMNQSEYICTAVLAGTTDGAGNTVYMIDANNVSPSSVAGSLTTVLILDNPVFIISHTAGLIQTYLHSITAGQPWQGWYTIQFDNGGGPPVTFPGLWPGDQLKFYTATAKQKSWPIGTFLKQTFSFPASLGIIGPQPLNYVYICNALPSKNVERVEGYGTVTDATGYGKRDFIPLGGAGQKIISGSTTSTVINAPFTINLNDSTWFSTLGQNVTSITFLNGQGPRDINSGCDDDRLWITLDGVEDVGDSTGNLISNPALIILQYLENTHLMNVAGSSINSASFAASAGALAGYFCGFAQVEAIDGLSLLQHIASLCHSALFFDQGEANIITLSDSPGEILWTGDTSTNDNILQGSLTVSESAVDDVINDLTFKWRSAWDDKTGQKLMDAKSAALTSVLAFGRMAKEINPCDIFWRREDVVAELNFWLAHLSTIWRYVTVQAFLDALVLQPGDWAKVQWIDGTGRDLFGGYKPMQVTQCVDTGKEGIIQLSFRYPIFTYM